MSKSRYCLEAGRMVGCTIHGKNELIRYLSPGDYPYTPDLIKTIHKEMKNVLYNKNIKKFSVLGFEIELKECFVSSYCGYFETCSGYPDWINGTIFIFKIRTEPYSCKK